MKENEPYIIDIPEPEFENTPKRRFPVFIQLLVLIFILGGLFAGFIIPKTTALLENNRTPTQNANTLAVSSEITNTDSSTIQKIEEVKLTAKSAYVWDVKEQRVLFQKNSDEVLPLASITKLMTALLAYELVPDDTLVKVSHTSANQQSGGSFKGGEVFKAKELADFSLVSSYNSAAYTLADSVGAMLGEKDPVSQFVAGMNIRAEELELASLKFLNPTGLDISDFEAGAFGNARDVSFLVEYILLNHPTILRPTIAPATRLYNDKGEYHDARNTNNIIREIPNLIGSKTGYTDLAGGNLMVAIDIGFNRPVIITVLGSTIDGRFSDVEKLIKAVQDGVIKSE